MKKKLVIVLSMFVLFILVGVIIYFNYNNQETIVTLDINPSIEITLDRGEVVKKVVSLNEDAKEVISDEMIGKTFRESFALLTKELIKYNYIERDRDCILISSKGKITTDDIVSTMKEVFGENDVNPEIIVPVITESSIKLAEELGISEAKAAYIEDIANKSENIDAQSLVNKSIDELKETKERGKYCDADYTLEGDFCIKVIGEERANASRVCPEGYYEYNGKCYKDAPVIDTDNLICENDRTLVNGKCARTVEINATPSKYSCTKGEALTRLAAGLTSSEAADAKDIVCVDTSAATHPVTPCELPADDPTERMSYGGKCYWHRAPVIESGCPGKIEVNGFCWDDATNIYICAGYRDGKQYSSKNEYCENSIKYLNPTVTEYSCLSGYTLKGSKCTKEETEEARHERTCPSGYTKLENDKCINYQETTSLVSGFKCERENTRLEGTKCEILEIIEAKEY